MKDDLHKKYEELSFLCLNYDPCHPVAPQAVDRLLKKYHLVHIDDPFMVTNELLKMLDKCESKIKQLEQDHHHTPDQFH